ncbi:MAG TPA: sigma-70 family RNA polymerase sigma factor [Pyrinomonadaceae bacterium]|jgi:DNA-directed RNA polymerase specialized sigma24 family protein
MADLTSEALKLLLERLDTDADKANDEYLTLHLKLERYFAWQDRGRYQADYSMLTDQTLDRAAKKIEAGVEIEKNIQAFALGIARFVWLEYIRRNPPSEDIDSIPERGYETEPLGSEQDDEDRRLACLRSCLAEIPRDDEERQLILGYYRKNGEKLKERRKSLAESLGINTNALKVRMTRLREKLKNCIGRCMEIPLRHM